MRSIVKLDQYAVWSFSVNLDFPFQWASDERHVEVACPRAAHTEHSRVWSRCCRYLLSSEVSILSERPSISSSNSSGSSFLHISDTQLPSLKNIHKCPHSSEGRSELSEPSQPGHREQSSFFVNESGWTALYLETMRGTTAFTTFFSVVSLVAHSQSLPSFSLTLCPSLPLM